MGISMATAHPNVGGHTRTAFGTLKAVKNLAWLSLIQIYTGPFKNDYFLSPLRFILNDS